MKLWKVGAVAAMSVAAAGLAAVAETSAQSRVEPSRRALEVLSFGSPRIGVTLDDTDGGVRVEGVDEDMPAGKAGIKTGDVIVEFDGERVRSRAQLTRLIQETPEGRKVNVVVTRSGQRMTFSVQPESRDRNELIASVMPRFREFETLRPTPAVPRPPRVTRPPMLINPRVPEVEIFRDGFAYSIGGGRLGISTETLNDQLAKHFGVERGVLVKNVSEDSAASKAGLRAGDVVTKINGSTVEDSGDLAREIGRASGEVSIEIVRDRKAQTLKATLPTESRSRGWRGI